MAASLPLSASWRKICGVKVARWLNATAPIQADLSLLDKNAKVIERVTTRFSAVDALVLCARHHRSTRTETVDGFEENFALFYLSRYPLGHGLAATPEKAARPVIANVAGPGGTSRIQWNDLELRQNYHGTGALGHGGRLNDLLGVAFAKRYGAGGTRYLLFHPGVVSTSFSGEYDRTTAAAVEQLKKSGKPVREATASIINRIDNPPDEPLSAFIEGERISVETRSSTDVTRTDSTMSHRGCSRSTSEQPR